MTDTVTRLMGLIEAYRTAGGREEHWARKDALEAELTRLFTPLSDEEIKQSVGAGGEYWESSKIYIKAIFQAAEKAHGIGGES